MKEILLDNCFVNRLIDDKFEATGNYAFLNRLKDERKIKIYCNPTNVLEIALCSNLKKRRALAEVLNQLVEGKNILLNWEAYQILFLFRQLDKEIPGILVSENKLLEFSKQYSILLVGMLGQMSIFEGYDIGALNYLIKQKLITKYYQAKLVSDPEYYLNLYIKQMNGALKKEDVEDDSKLDLMKISELEKLVEDTVSTRKKIKNIKKFSKYKKEMIYYFSHQEMKTSFFNFFMYKEHIEKSINVKKLCQVWSGKIFGKNAKPLSSELCEVFSLPSASPTLQAYHRVLWELVDRLPDDYIFSLDKMFYLYLNEIEKILNNAKDLSRGSGMDMDYFPSMLMVDYFITDDKELYGNCNKVLSKMPHNANKVLSYRVSWKKEIES